LINILLKNIDRDINKLKIYKEFISNIILVMDKQIIVDNIKKKIEEKYGKLNNLYLDYFMLLDIIKFCEDNSNKYDKNTFENFYWNHIKKKFEKTKDIIDEKLNNFNF